jgi:hypothetical protein
MCKSEILYIGAMDEFYWKLRLVVTDCSLSVMIGSNLRPDFRPGHVLSPRS